ncbi:hypothetical protein CEUSTIGMA_g7672.t1 [Chlamydomonas eustigma]|uniref:Uncharacterized protein n=1 Tax=Chlamydomonas eustigma TaxID=1157962 RepID=A0A250XAZ6_9CHLO|nr:hypothetical protein CEUSTIGMA_g7672.t1 [Chlamydomonas eustigma]|eukprot:GAX80234.1 hypothetical protein CEUSTIGMA_g7672.t1 [Chlamydomonas eustigma]
MIDSMNIPTAQAYDLQLGIKETAQDVLGRKTPPVVFSKRLPLLPHESKDSILATALATDNMSGSGAGLHHHLQGPQRSAAAPRSTHTVGSALERDMAAASGAPSQSGTPSMLSKAPSLSGSSPPSTETNQRQSIATTHLTPHPPTALEGFRSRAGRVSLARKMGLLLVERPASPQKRAFSSYSILGMTTDTDASNYLSNESSVPIGGPTASVTISRSSSTSLPYGSTISQSQFSLPPSPPAVLKSGESRIPSVAAAAALAAGLKASQAKSERAVDATGAAAGSRQRASASAGRTRRFASLMPDSSSSSEMLNSLMMQSWSGANKMEPEGSFLSGPLPLSNSNALLPTALDSLQQPRAKSMPMKSKLNPVPKGSFPDGIKQRTSLGEVSQSEGRGIRDPAVERGTSLNGRATAAAWESTSDKASSSHTELSGSNSSNAPTQPPTQSKVMRQAPAAAAAAPATSAGLSITSSTPIARPATAVGSNGGGSTLLIGSTKPLMPEAASKPSASRSAPDNRKSRGLLMSKVVAKASLAFQSLTASSRPAAAKT